MERCHCLAQEQLKAWTMGLFKPVWTVTPLMFAKGPSQTVGSTGLITLPPEALPKTHHTKTTALCHQWKFMFWIILNLSGSGHHVSVKNLETKIILMPVLMLILKIVTFFKKKCVRMLYYSKKPRLNNKLHCHRYTESAVWVKHY